MTHLHARVCSSRCDVDPAGLPHTLAHVDRPIAQASLELSTDNGCTRTPAKLTRKGPTRYRVRYGNPVARGTSRFMSMRVTGTDASGDSVREVALRVYRLR